MSILAIDWDDTFTADPRLFRGLAELCLATGWQVICVTAQHECDRRRKEIESGFGFKIHVIMSGSEAKADYCRRVHNIEVDVWVDDCPQMIIGEQTLLNAAYEVIAEKQQEIANLSKTLEEQETMYRGQIERLMDLVDECREQRDQARNIANQEIQREMSDLRKELAAAKNSSK